MDKQETLDYLREQNIPFELTEHAPIFHMGEPSSTPFPYPGADAKNLFVRDKKHRDYYLITVRGEKRVDLKEFRREHGTRGLTFADADELEHFLGVEPGSVSPLGVLNDEERKVKVFLDADFWKAPHRAGVHPNENTATVWLDPDDLKHLIEAHGNEVEVTSL